MGAVPSLCLLDSLVTRADVGPAPMELERLEHLEGRKGLMVINNLTNSCFTEYHRLR